MTTSLSLSLLVELKEMRPDLWRAATEAIKYFIGVMFAKRRSTFSHAAVLIQQVVLRSFTSEEFERQNSQLFT